MRMILVGGVGGVRTGRRRRRRWGRQRREMRLQEVLSVLALRKPNVARAEVVEDRDLLRGQVRLRRERHNFLVHIFLCLRFIPLALALLQRCRTHSSCLTAKKRLAANLVGGGSRFFAFFVLISFIIFFVVVSIAQAIVVANSQPSAADEKSLLLASRSTSFFCFSVPPRLLLKLLLLLLVQSDLRRGRGKSGRGGRGRGRACEREQVGHCRGQQALAEGSPTLTFRRTVVERAERRDSGRGCACGQGIVRGVLLMLLLLGMGLLLHLRLQQERERQGRGVHAFARRDAEAAYQACSVHGARASRCQAKEENIQSISTRMHTAPTQN